MGDVKRYDCTNGKARFCYGCYEMTEDADGNYVQASDFDAALAREAALREELATVKSDKDAANAVLGSLGAALKAITLMARTSGGTPGPDEKLMDACESAERVLSLVGVSGAIDMVDYLQQRLTAAEQRNTAVHKLSPEAYSVVIGMVEHCLNIRACMGMDEGYNDYENEESEHDFVKEIREFVAASDKPTESGASE